MKKNVLAIIPARGGSKGVVDKNIAIVGKKPLISWTISKALESKYIDRVVVTTDSQAIANIANEYGAETPFLRPIEIAQDDTPGIIPIIHTINYLKEKEGYLPENIICLPPTSPLREVSDIDNAFEILIEKEADSVISVTKVSSHPYWMKKLDNNGLMNDFLENIPFISSRQELPDLYNLNGSIYLGKTSLILEKETWYHDNTFAYVMLEENSWDINTKFEIDIADYLLIKRINEKL